MYFSMHWVKQVSSPLDSEVPGLGTQRSKQCSFNFCIWARALSLANFQAIIAHVCRIGNLNSVAKMALATKMCWNADDSYLDQLAGICDSGLLTDLLHNSNLGVGGIDVEGVHGGRASSLRACESWGGRAGCSASGRLWLLSWEAEVSSQLQLR